MRVIELSPRFPGMRGWVLLVLLLAGMSGRAWGSGINTDVAMTPNRDGGVFRLRLIAEEGDIKTPSTEIDALSVSATVAYGLRANLALFLNLPYVRREGKMSAGASAVDQGIADFTIFGKYRFIQRDTGPVDTQRWAWIGGVNVRSGDSDVSSESVDPLGGVVYSLQRGRSHVDADLLYQINTGSGASGDDVLRYDAAYSYRVYPERFKPGKAYSLETVAELNGHYTTDGSHTVFVSPGLQYHLERWTFETSLQLPLFQDVAPNRMETDYRVLAGFRFHF